MQFAFKVGARDESHLFGNCEVPVPRQQEASLRRHYEDRLIRIGKIEDAQLHILESGLGRLGGFAGDLFPDVFLPQAQHPPPHLLGCEAGTPPDPAFCCDR